MKTKTMLAIAALSATMVIQAKADGIVSSSVVGYATSDAAGTQYIQVGNAFESIGSSDKEFTLSVIQPKAYDAGSDILQLISSVNARTIDQYVYITAEEADGDPDLIGWWDPDIENSKNDLTFDIGQGFKANFAAKGVAFNNAGEVNMDATEIDYSGKQFVVVPNILPRNMLLGEIVGINTDAGSDIVQKLSTTNARTIDQMVYVSEEEADGDPDLIGWWDPGIEESKNEVEIAVNRGLYANFAAKNAKLAFPAASTPAP